MVDLLTDDDAIRAVCQQHTFTVTPYFDALDAVRGEPVQFDVDCSCGGLHMGGNISEVTTLIQSHMRAHGAPVSQWWYRRHPDHPLEAGRTQPAKQPSTGA